MNIHEQFLGFIPLEATIGSALTEYVVRKLADMNISIANMCDQGNEVII